VRIHAIGDGAYSNTHIKISVENIKPSTSDTYKYGSFDLVVRKFDDTDLEKKVLEAYRGVNLDPSSDKFIARAIGDMYSYFDFDQASSSQKLVVAGSHPVRSNYIRVEQSSTLKKSQVPKDALPFGFRGIDHLVTSGSGPLTGVSGSGVDDDVFAANVSGTLKRAVQPPLPLRLNVAVGTSPNKREDPTWYWGAKFMHTVNVSNRNINSLRNETLPQLTKFFPSYGGSNRDFLVGNNPGVADSSGTVLDCDKFNNNIFSLERLTVRTGSDEKADSNEWVSASYTRNGNITANHTNKTRAFKASDLSIQGNRTFAKYTFPLQGGFDGLNIFDKDAHKLLNASAKREMDDSTAQGGTDGSTISAYRKALDIMGTKSDVDIKLLSIPGMRHSSISNYAVDTVESRFDAMYVMDIEERDEMNSVITSSVGSFANVANTVEAFKSRALDTSFAASYFPDVIMTDPTTFTNVQCPPSVAVMGAMALNDAVGYPWFAPAGFTRGALNDVLFADVPLNKANMDDIYDADINPLTSFPNTGVMVFGQKTLLAAASALDRVNVRRLLIDIRRKVRNVANLMLFEPNRQETLDKFSALVQPILQSVQEKSGVDRFKVVIDATTTTQADIENNTLRGKIFLQPTRTAEFVALDFVLTNAGDAFENA
jgi:phage tail sheath protein FI